MQYLLHFITKIDRQLRSSFNRPSFSLTRELVKPRTAVGLHNALPHTSQVTRDPLCRGCQRAQFKLFLSLCLCLSIYLSTCQSVSPSNLSIYFPSIHLSIHISNYVHECVCICLCKNACQYIKVHSRCTELCQCDGVTVQN